MTTPPLPASPCIRIKLDYTNLDGSQAGSRFYMQYSGTTPTAAQLVSLCAVVSNSWVTHLAPLVSSIWTLTEIDIEDIASDTGAFGTSSVSHPGSAGSAAPPANCCTNVEFDIARRYRGGKPRMFVPPTDTSHLADNAHWNAAFITSMNTAMASFMGDIEVASEGSFGPFTHVNLSYYKDFTNVTNSSGRTRAAPKYRATALVDTVTGYATKGLVGSQRRRRAATTP